MANTRIIFALPQPHSYFIWKVLGVLPISQTSCIESSLVINWRPVSEVLMSPFSAPGNRYIKSDQPCLRVFTSFFSREPTPNLAHRYNFSYHPFEIVDIEGLRAEPTETGRLVVVGAKGWVISGIIAHGENGLPRPQDTNNPKEIIENIE
jgi:hypothetical protein